jgi:hypothetical protein
MTAFAGMAGQFGTVIASNSAAHYRVGVPI